MSRFLPHPYRLAITHHATHPCLPPSIQQRRRLPASSTTVSDDSDDRLDRRQRRELFDGAPIVPGAMMQEMTTQAAGILIAANFNPMSEFTTHDPYANHYALGVLIKVKAARFKGFARPGATMHIRSELIESINQTFDFVGRITIDGQTIMRNEFQLSNILSKTLQGIT
jgi:3-hydroxymyristoyl/3-hydroxydecanoyl-(acyl carrier protein) dehydratase